MVNQGTYTNFVTDEKNHTRRRRRLLPHARGLPLFYRAIPLKTWLLL
jgi:hypothetical protein